jgi:hypothetical protein
MQEFGTNKTLAGAKDERRAVSLKRSLADSCITFESKAVSVLEKQG